MRRLGTVVIVLYLALWAGLAFAQSNSTTAVPYVYRLKIGNCTFDPVDRRQTGFRVQGTVGIVTALHGVADCQTISAVADNGQEIFNDLDIVQVDIERDIALLVSPELAQRTSDGLALSTLTASAILTTPLSITGYPLGLDAQDVESNLLVRDLEPLDAIIPDPEETDALRLRHSPALTITVLNLQAQLLPGHSGAPLFDPENRLVGVGNGGLRGGTVNRSWAIPWSDVQLQPVTLPQVKQGLTALSAMEPSLALAFSSTYPEQPESSAKLVKFSGRIVDQQTNRGIGSTEVLLVFDEAGEYRVSYSDTRGFFVFEFAPTKERSVGTIAIEAAGYDYQLLPVELGAERSIGRILLQPLSPTPTPTATASPTPEPTVTPQPTVQVRVIMIGVGFASESQTNEARRKQSALLAAQKDANRNLVLWRDGADLDSVTIVDQGEVQTDRIREEIIRTRVRSGTVISQSYDNTTGEAQVTVEYVVEIPE